MSKSQITVVSMSFLDLLSCALGAVLLLDIIFSLSLKPGDTTEQGAFVAMHFVVDSTTNLDPSMRVDEQVDLLIEGDLSGVKEAFVFQERGIAKVLGGRCIWASKLDKDNPQRVHISASLEKLPGDVELIATLNEGEFGGTSAYMHDGKLVPVAETKGSIRFSTDARVERLLGRD